MDDFELPQIAYEKLNTGYGDQWELMRDLFSLIDYRLYIHYKYHRWLGPDNSMKNMLGLVVSREEFEYNLAKSSQVGIMSQVSDEEAESIRLGDDVLRERIAVTTQSVRLLEVFDRFKLSEFERQCVGFVYAAETDEKYSRLLAYLQDDITKKSPGIALAIQLFLPSEASIEEYTALFDRESAFTSLFDRAARGEGMLKLRSFVREFLGGGTVVLPLGMSVFHGASERPGGAIVTGKLIARRLDEIFAATKQRSAAVMISGPRGCGKHFQVKHLMTRLRADCLFADFSFTENADAAVPDAAFIAQLLDAHLVLGGLEPTAVSETEPPTTIVPRSVAKLEADGRLPAARALFVLTEKPVQLDLSRPTLELEIAPTTADERLRLFEHYMAGVPLDASVSLSEIATKFRFEPLQIRRTAEQAVGELRLTGGQPIQNDVLHRICYRRVTHNLDRLASKLHPMYEWDDLILPHSQKALMQRACDHIRYKHRVYHDWNFDSKISYGKGLSILFSGAPGTGKTMCAQIIARQLNMEAYKVNISQIVSKYIGETEKNLQTLFNEARNSNCILFFDECDAIFGKRSDVKDSHDRNANIEVAYLLQQIEEHDGVCILASNLIHNMDAAFLRRITYVVRFPFPDAPTRREIYLNMLPPALPVDDAIDWDFIAEKFELSGGHIKNIVLAAAFMAASEEIPMCMRHVLTAAVTELRKNEIVIVREAFREYADLIFDE